MIKKQKRILRLAIYIILFTVVLIPLALSTGTKGAAYLTNACYVVNSSSGIPLKSAKSNTSSILATIPNGTYIYVLTDKNGTQDRTWGYTRYGGSEGWINLGSVVRKDSMPETSKEVALRMEAIQRFWSNGSTWKGSKDNNTVGGYVNSSGSYLGQGQCFGFAAEVWRGIWGDEMSQLIRGSRYELVMKDSMQQVGSSLKPNAHDAQSVQALLSKAKRGDVIQTGNSVGNLMHTLVVDSVSADGITIYDANTSGPNKVRTAYYTWNEFHIYRSNYGITLYTHKNYPPENLSPVSGGAVVTKTTSGVASTSYYITDKVVFSADIKNATTIKYYIVEAKSGAVVAESGSSSTFSYTFNSLTNGSSDYYVYYVASNAESTYTSSKTNFTVKLPTISILGGDVSVPTGSNFTFNYNSTPSNARVVWTSSNNAAAYVVSNAVINARAAGDAVITATLIYTGTGGSQYSVSSGVRINVYNPTYTITFNANGGSTPTASKTVTNTSKYGELPNPTRTGYTFAGWYRDVSGGNRITSDTIVSLSGNTTLYAHWTPNVYNVNFNGNGGSISTGSKKVQYDSTYGEMPIPVRPGYNFDGWFTDAAGGTRIADTNKVSITADQTLYAHWSLATFTVTFNANGGTASFGTKNVTYTMKYGDMPTASRTGYTFAGWFTEASNGSMITSDNTVDITSNITLYAHWIANTYTVKFNPNGGNLEKNSMSVIFDAAYGALPMPVRSGYSFQGWFTENGERIVNTTQVKIASEHTLIAHWELGRFTVVFETNGGTSLVESKVVTYLTTYGELPVPSRVGYTFVGWFTDPKDGEQIVESTPVNIIENQSLFAHWNVNTYTVSFNTGKSNDKFDSIRVTFDTKYGILPVPTRLGYTFSGWYTAESNGELIKEDSILKIGEDSTLYAGWIPNKYKVILNANTGIAPVEYVTVDYELPYGEIPAPTKKGYIFKGWFTALDGGELITADKIVDNASDITVYAKWEAKKINVSFKLNGGNTDGKDIIVGFDDKYGELPLANRIGYSFVGWQDENGVMVNSDSIMDIDHDTTLNAIWEALKYNVTLKLADGKFTDGSTEMKIEVTYDSPYPTMPTPEKTGHRFVGWMINDKNHVYSGDIVKITESQVFTADWTPNIYGISFDPDGGIIDIDMIKVYYGDKYGTLAKAERPGYRFDGWYTADDKKITSDMTVNITENMTLKAHWISNIYTVKFMPNGGELNINEMKVNFGETYGILPEPIREGYKFTHWIDENGEIILADSIVNILKNSTFTAEWVALNYEITFVSGDNSLVVPPKMVTYDKPYGQLPEIEREGYIFEGWYIDDEQITADTVVKNAKNKTASAHWHAIEYTVIFDPNGGDIDRTEMKYTCDQTYAMTPYISKMGYNFAGWYDENGNKVLSDTKVKMEDGIIFKAHWEKAAYNIFFSVDKKIDTRYTMNAFYGDPYGILPEFVTPGYEFKYWADSNGREILSTDIYNYVTDSTLYAVLIPKQYEMTFFAGDGEAEYSHKTVSYNSKIGKLPTAIKRGYIFSGWYTENGKIITESSMVDFTDNITLHARWEELAGNTEEMFGGNTMLITGCEIIVGVNILLLGITTVFKKRKKKYKD